MMTLPSGGDLSDQKATSVVVAAHYLAGPSLRRQLAQLMSARDLDERLTRALHGIDSHSLDPIVRVALTSMAAACTRRAA
jgi:geranylgeranyl diphosphate synthase, type I